MLRTARALNPVQNPANYPDNYFSGPCAEPGYESFNVLFDFFRRSVFMNKLYYLPVCGNKKGLKKVLGKILGTVMNCISEGALMPGTNEERKKTEKS